MYIHKNYIQKSNSQRRVLLMNITDKQLNFTPALYQYIFSHNPEENIHLKNLRLRTDQLKYARLRSPTEQVQLITFLLKLLKPKNILELGTFTVYATLAMALATDDSTKIITCDINNVFPSIGIPFWEQSTVGNKIQLILGPALETVSKLEKQNALFDFIYIDADKENYLNYFEQSLTILNKSGLIVIDNVLWHG